MAKKKGKSKFLKKALFFQDWGCVPNETLVSLGMNADEVISCLKKFSGTEKIKEDILKSKDFSSPETVYGVVFFNGNKSVLMLHDSEGRSDWQKLLVILHETNHLAFIGIHEKRAENESEFVAYVQEYLFDQIFQKLTKNLPIPKKDNQLKPA